MTTQDHHVAETVKSFIKENQVQIIEQSSYSPDNASSYFCMFEYIKSQRGDCMNAKSLNGIKEWELVFNAVENILNILISKFLIPMTLDGPTIIPSPHWLLEGAIWDLVQVT